MKTTSLFALLAWTALGVGGGVLAHYVLYRVGLPLKPFIYVAF